MTNTVSLDIELLQELPELEALLTNSFDDLAGCKITCAHTCSVSSGS